MKKTLVFLSLVLVFAACKKDDPAPVVVDDPAEEVVDGYAKTVLVEPTTSVTCGACPLAHHYQNVLEDSLNDVIHMSHYLHGPLYHDYTDHLIDKINKTVYTPLAHIQRRDEGEGTVYYRVDRLNEIVGAERLNDAIVGLDGRTTEDGTNLMVEIELNSTETFKDSKFRIHAFLVEKVVTGDGSGYDQRNYGNNDPDHPYYGQGEYIVGFKHTNVIRDVLSDYDGDMVELDGTTTTWAGSVELADLSESLEAYAVVAFVTDDDDSVTPILNAVLFEAKP